MGNRQRAIWHAFSIIPAFTLSGELRQPDLECVGSHLSTNHQLGQNLANYADDYERSVLKYCYVFSERLRSGNGLTILNKAFHM